MDPYNDQLEVLVIEDSSMFQMMCQAMIYQALGSNVVVYDSTTLEGAIQVITSLEPDLIITDLDLPDSKGVHTVEKLLRIEKDAPVIVLSGDDNFETARAALEAGAQDYLVKGKDDPESFRRIITYAIERKKNERALKHNEEQFRMLVKHTPAAVAMLDTQMRYILYSDRWLKDYRLPKQDLIGASHFELFPDLPDEKLAIYEQCMQGESKRSKLEKVILPDGSIEYMRWEIIPWHNVHYEVGGIIIFSEIITEQYLFQQQQKRQKAELEFKVQERTKRLEEVSQLKNRFFTNITHELRTPLHAIINFSQFGLKKTKAPDDATIHEYFDSVYISAKRLSSLVDDLLDLAKFQSSGMPCHPDFCNLAELIEEVRRGNAATLQDRKMTLKVANVLGDVAVYLDRSRIIQVLTNLVSNAVKFSPEGSTITLGAIESEEDGMQWLQMWVEDQGIGIPESELECVFDEFHQSTKVVEGQFYKGTGIGLAVCKEILKSHGGTIWAENLKDGGGALIQFRLPMAACVLPDSSGPRRQE